MDQNQNQSFSTYSSTPPVMSSQPTPMNETMAPMSKPKKVGPIVAIAVAILIILIVGIYLVSKQFEVISPSNEITTGANIQSAVGDQNVEQAQPTPAQEVKAITNSNDDLQSLQSDLDVSIQGLDAQQI